MGRPFFLPGRQRGGYRRTVQRERYSGCRAGHAPRSTAGRASSLPVARAPRADAAQAVFPSGDAFIDRMITTGDRATTPATARAHARSSPEVAIARRADAVSIFICSSLLRTHPQVDARLRAMRSVRKGLRKSAQTDLCDAKSDTPAETFFGFRSTPVGVPANGGKRSPVDAPLRCARSRAKKKPCFYRLFFYRAMFGRCARRALPPHRPCAGGGGARGMACAGAKFFL